MKSGIALSSRLDRTIELLTELIAFDTVGEVGVTNCMDYLAEVLHASGGEVMRVSTPGSTAQGLHIRFGPDRAGGLALSGHVDVVGVDGQTWTGDPFVLRRNGEKLIGRGAVDMKGFLACSMTHAEATARMRQHPLHLLLSTDEETTCHSARALASHVRDHVPTPCGVIIGEPTLLRPVNRHHGSCTVNVEVIGRASHAGRRDQAVDANLIAAKTDDMVGRAFLRSWPWRRGPHSWSCRRRDCEQYRVRSLPLRLGLAPFSRRNSRRRM